MACGVTLDASGAVGSVAVHLSVPPGFRAKAEGVVLHRAVVPPAEKEDHSGFWVTTPLRSLVDVASGSLDLVRPTQVLVVVRHVFESRGTHDVPAELPDPPASWHEALSPRLEGLG